MIGSIIHQPEEQQRRRSTRQRTPRTSLTASSFSNRAVKVIKLEYQKQQTKGNSSGKVLAA